MEEYRVLLSAAGHEYPLAASSWSVAKTLAEAIRRDEYWHSVQVQIKCPYHDSWESGESGYCERCVDEYFYGLIGEPVETEI